MGIATLTAASCQQNLVDIDNVSYTFGVDVLPTDTVGMVGYIEPIAEKLLERAKLIVFDSGVSKSGRQIDIISKMEDQPKLLPSCDVVLITGTTIINGTIDELLNLCKNAREIVLVGSSTPMFPEAFKKTNVTVLAGAWWNKNHKKELFKLISIASGISHVKKSMIKKAIRVINS